MGQAQTIQTPIVQLLHREAPTTKRRERKAKSEILSSKIRRTRSFQLVDDLSCATRQLLSIDVWIHRDIFTE